MVTRWRSSCRRRRRVEDLDLTEGRSPTVRRAEQVSLDRRQHRRSVPLEDPAHRGRRLARTRRAHEHERSPVASPGSSLLICGRSRLCGDELPAEAGDGEAARLRGADQERRDIARPREPRPGIDAERSPPGRADLGSREPLDGERHRHGHRARGKGGAEPVDDGAREVAGVRLGPRRRRVAQIGRQPSERVTRGTSS